MGVKTNFMDKRKLQIGVNCNRNVQKSREKSIWDFFLNDKNPRVWDVRFLLNYPPPLSDFVLFCLTPPSPPKIGHHLCTLPKSNKKNVMIFSFSSDL